MYFCSSVTIIEKPEGGFCTFFAEYRPPHPPHDGLEISDNPGFTKANHGTVPPPPAKWYVPLTFLSGYTCPSFP